MSNELTIKTNMGEFSVFLQKGFYSHPATSVFHDHNYVEIHMLIDGNAVFNIEGKKCKLRSGDILIVPPKTLHACIRQDDTARHTAFQIDQAVHSVAVHSIDPHIIRSFFEEIKRCGDTGDHTLISAFIALFCCYCHKSQEIQPKAITNYGFIIYEFFSRHYNEDIHLCDLANTLYLSERQAERLVIKHTGRTFRQNLAKTRILMAKQLMASTDMSLSEIAKYVGYNSYAGFWKAMKKYEETL